MARVLVMTSGLVGITLACLEVVRRLEEAGHEVVLASPHGAAASLVAGHGVRFEVLAPVVRDPAPQPSGGGRLGRKLAELRTARARRAAGAAALGLEAFHADLERLRPDLVLVDLELDEHVLTLLARGVRVGLLSQWFEHLRRPGLPPLGSSIVPGEGLAGSPAGLASAWARTRAARTRRRLAVWARYFGTDRRGVLLHLARELGLGWTVAGGLDWVTPFGMVGVPVLSLTPLELEFEHPVRPERTYVGPMVRQDRAPGAEGEQVLAGIEAFAGAARAAGRRVLYASASTKDGGDAPFLERLLRAVAPMGDLALVVAAGGDAEAARRVAGAAGERAALHVVPWAPQLDALRLADGALNHGGIHSILEAAVLGRPMVVASGGRTDQDGCAARMAAHRAAVVVPRAAGDGAVLAAAVREALFDGERARNATLLAERLGRYREERVLERAVEELLAAPPRVRAGR